MRQRQPQAKRFWTPERTLAMSALFISVCALGVSIYSAHQDRLHKRLSVKPNVWLAFYYGDKGAGWRSGNSGFGPALVRWFAVYVDDQPKSSWYAAAEALRLPHSYRFLVPTRGEVKPAGAETLIFWFDPGPAAG